MYSIIFYLFHRGHLPMLKDRHNNHRSGQSDKYRRSNTAEYRMLKWENNITHEKKTRTTVRFVYNNYPHQHEGGHQQQVFI